MLTNKPYYKVLPLFLFNNGFYAMLFIDLSIHQKIFFNSDDNIDNYKKCYLGSKSCLKFSVAITIINCILKQFFVIIFHNVTVFNFWLNVCSLSEHTRVL